MLLARETYLKGSLYQKWPYTITCGHNFSLCVLLRYQTGISLQELSYDMLTLGIANIIPKLQVQSSTHLNPLSALR